RAGDRAESEAQDLCRFRLEGSECLENPRPRWKTEGVSGPPKVDKSTSILSGLHRSRKHAEVECLCPFEAIDCIACIIRVVDEIRKTHPSLLRCPVLLLRDSGRPPLLCPSI